MDMLLPLCCFLVWVLLFAQKTSINGSTETTEKGIIIGAIVDNSSRIGKEEMVAMKMAFDDFFDCCNQSFVLQIRNSQREPMQAALLVAEPRTKEGRQLLSLLLYVGLLYCLSLATDLINTQQVQAILGPRTWEETSLVAEVCNQNHIPILSFADTAPNWTTERWPFLVQASPDQFKQMKAIAAIVQTWEWHQVTVIYEDTDSSAARVLPLLSDALYEVDAEISHLLALSPFTSSSSLPEELERLKGGQCRVFVVHLSLHLAELLFETAKRMKMMEKDYVWITTNPITSLVHSMNASTISSMQGVLGVKSYFPETEDRFQDFYLRFIERFSLEHPEEDNHEPGIFAVQAYDAAWTVALAMRESQKGGHQLLLDKILLSDFRGFSGKFQFIDQKLGSADTFQIVNVIGKSYIELGFWSDGVGFTKTIDESATNSSSMKVLRQVLWPGGPSYDPRGWTLPTIANRLRIGVPTRTVFKKYMNVEYDQYSENNISCTGFAIDVFKATLDELPFYLPYHFLPFYGTYNELVEQIYLKEFDAVVGDVTIVARRYEYVEFTYPYTDSGLVMIVPVQSKTSNRAWLFMKPFTKAMWVLIAAINVYNGFVIWLIERNYCPELNGSVLNQMGTLIWLAFSTLFALQGRERMHSNLSRMTLVMWLFVALVITQTYTANLTSMLTVQQLEPTVADVESLQKANAIIGTCNGSAVFRYLVDVFRFNPNNIKTFPSPEDYAQALKTRQITAAFLELPLAKLFLAKYCTGFTIAGPTYKVGGFGYAFPKGSPLLPSITEALLKVSESGKLRELENNMIASVKCDEAEPDDRTPSLSPNSFLVLFILTAATSTFALVLYIFSVDKSMFGHYTIWRLMMAVMKRWSSQKRRFSRRVSDTAVKSSPSYSPDTLDLWAQV